MVEVLNQLRRRHAAAKKKGKSEQGIPFGRHKSAWRSNPSAIFVFFCVCAPGEIQSVGVRKKGHRPKWSTERRKSEKVVCDWILEADRMQRFQVHTSNAGIVLFVLLALLGASSDVNTTAIEASAFYGRSYRGGSDSNRMVFPNEKERYSLYSKDVKREVDEYDGCCDDDIPLELALQLGNITSSDDVFNLVEPDSIDQRIFSKEGFGERSAGEIPTPAGCNTQPTIVSLRPENNSDPRLIYSPSCTRVQRCSGCCVSKRLSCQPTSTRTRTFTVNVLEYVSGTKTRFKSRDLALIEEHVGCACQCRVKEEHCNSLQRYNSRNCRCDCANNDDRSKCLKEQDIKQWNPDTCLCECNEAKECTSGTYFDHNYCRCLKTSFYSIH